jgi:hypothetical protein
MREISTQVIEPIWDQDLVPGLCYEGGELWDL